MQWTFVIRPWPLGTYLVTSWSVCVGTLLLPDIGIVSIKSKKANFGTSMGPFVQSRWSFFWVHNCRSARSGCRLCAREPTFSNASIAIQCIRPISFTEYWTPWAHWLLVLFSTRASEKRKLRWVRRNPQQPRRLRTGNGVSWFSQQPCCSRCTVSLGTWNASVWTMSKPCPEHSIEYLGECSECGIRRYVYGLRTTTITTKRQSSSIHWAVYYCMCDFE